MNNSFLGVDGLHLIESDQATIIGNSFRAGGVLFEDWKPVDAWWDPGHTILDNTINGKPIIYLSNRSGKKIDPHASQVFVFHCNNIILGGLELRNVSAGVFIFQSKSILIRDSAFVNARTGIIIKYSTDVSISSSTFTDIPFAITTSESFTSITRCSFLNSGVRLGDRTSRIDDCIFLNDDPFSGIDAIHNSGTLTILDSDISGYYQGIYQDASDLTITNTTIQSNIIGLYLDRFQGLFMDSCTIRWNGWDGIEGTRNDQFTIQNSFFLNNGGYGINIRGSYSEIMNVTVEGNLEGGIKVEGYKSSVSHSVVRNNKGPGIAGIRYIDNCTIEMNGGGVVSSWTDIEYSMIINNTEFGVLGSYRSGIISNSTISGSPVGVHMDYSTINLSHCVISDVDTAFIVHRPGENVSIFRCIILVNPDGIAIRTTPFNAFHVDARECYWGDPTGPYHVTKNPLGGGGAIGDEIFFEPWYRDPEFTDLDVPDEEDHDPSYGGTLVMAFLLLLLAGLPFAHVSRIHSVVEAGRSPFNSLLHVQWATLPKGLSLAPIRGRIIASVLDGIIICLLLFPPLAIFIDRMDQVTTNHLLALSAYLFFPVIYFFLFEGIFGRTPGKQVAGIRVISLDGPQTSLSKLIIPSLVKGFIFPICHIVMGLTGIFLHPDTLQRHTQYRARLMVILEPSSTVRRSEFMVVRKALQRTRHDLHTTRTSLSTFITGSPSIYDLEDRIYFTEQQLERNNYRQPGEGEPTWGEVESMRVLRDTIRSAQFLMGELSIWSDRMSSYLTELDQNKSPPLRRVHSGKSFLQRVRILQARHNLTRAGSLIGDAESLLERTKKIGVTN